MSMMVLYRLTDENMKDIAELLLKENVPASYFNNKILMNGKTYVEGDFVCESNLGICLMRINDLDNTFKVEWAKLSKHEKTKDLKVSECPRTHFLTRDNIHDIYMRISRYVKDNVQLNGDVICLWGKDRFTRLSEGDVVWEPREGYFIPIDRDDYYINYEPTPEVKNEKQNNEQQLRKELCDNTVYGLREFIPRIYHLTNDNIEIVYNRMRLYGYTVYPYGDKTGKKIGIARYHEQEIVLGSGDVIIESAEGIFLPFKYEDYAKLCRHNSEI